MQSQILETYNELLSLKLVSLNNCTKFMQTPYPTHFSGNMLNFSGHLNSEQQFTVYSLQLSSFHHQMFFSGLCMDVFQANSGIRNFPHRKQEISNTMSNGAVEKLFM